LGPTVNLETPPGVERVMMGPGEEAVVSRYRFTLGTLRAAVGLAALLALTPLVLAGSAAAAPQASPALCAGHLESELPPDYNGDGYGDFVIGLPGADDGTGAIELVLHGHQPVIYQPGSGGIPAMPPGAHFGAVTQPEDLNSDGCLDLLVGVPGLTVDGIAGAGGVQTLLGSPDGFQAGALITQGPSGAPGQPQLDGHFGAAISTDGPAGPNEDVYVAVGVPGATVAVGPDHQPLLQAGEVVYLEVNSAGALGQSITGPGDLDTMPKPQAGAHFGAVVILYYAVTAPDAHHGKKLDTGYIELSGGQFYGRSAGARLGTTLVTDNSFGGDDGIGLDVGAPGQSVDSRPGAGAVERFVFYPDGGQALYRGSITQASPGVPGHPQREAHFGTSLSATFGSSDPATRESNELAIGAPDENIGSAHHAGAVDVRVITYHNGRRLGTRWIAQTMATRGVPGVAAADDHFGAAVSAIPVQIGIGVTSDLIVGVPGHAAAGQPAAGAVDLIALGVRGPIDTGAVLLDRVDGPQPGDRFGAWVK
jgi:hypothetical protein